MDGKNYRIFGIELIGTYALVLFSAGLVCINEITTPRAWHQPGLAGIALGQGLILAAMLALTAPITGGYLNPAIVVMQWVFNRVETPRAGWLLGAQCLGSAMAGLSLYFTFDPAVLQNALYGAPHINIMAYPESGQRTQFTGALLELVLTFFLVFAIFGLAEGADALRLGLVAGMIMTVCALFGLPLTGAALNPARWLGPTLLQAYSSSRAAWTDSLVYLAGPILGALAGGFFVFKVYQPALAEKSPS